MKKYIALLTMMLISSATQSCGGTDDSTKTSPAPEFPSDEGTNMWAIDMTPLEIDGKYYAVWSGWDKYYENREGNGQYLYIAEMTFHSTQPRVRLGDRVLLSSPEKSWELKQNENFSLLEGPQILKHGDDIFIIYSTRGSWTINYKLGQLKLTNRAKPLDPASWTKKETPVFKGITQSDGLGYLVYGVGHASFTTSPDDTEYWINYHAKTSSVAGWTDRKIFFQRFTFDEATGDPDFGVPANSSNPMTRPSGETKIDKEQFGITSPKTTFKNPVRDGADPWITKHDGKYYVCRMEGRRLWIAESPYLTRFVNAQGQELTWEQARRDGGWTPPALNSNSWNRASHWAPELHHIDGKWYVFYAAGKQREAPYWEQRAGVLVSDDGPFGPYKEHHTKPLFTGEKDE